MMHAPGISKTCDVKVVASTNSKNTGNETYSSYSLFYFHIFSRNRQSKLKIVQAKIKIKIEANFSIPTEVQFEVDDFSVHSSKSNQYLLCNLCNSPVSYILSTILSSLLNLEFFFKAMAKL